MCDTFKRRGPPLFEKQNLGQLKEGNFLGFIGGPKIKPSGPKKLFPQKPFVAQNFQIITSGYLHKGEIDTCMELESTFHGNKKDRSIIPTVELKNSQDNTMPLIAMDEIDNTWEILDTQLLNCDEPTPIQSDNIIKLSKEFGVLLNGCHKEEEALFMKLDQKRELEKIIAITVKPNNNSQQVPEEVRNLICEIRYKDGDPKSESRSRERTTTTMQS
ncbi:hypothetical protein H5410_029771 [Solanum commersonii]|uniref:Uncharacterized protein n=1 Tax=Solanum commersonii TaxID=4109 RepID=A0A9J5YDP4_SOLCO|nr:hypothetical protein H5410_029771 [Solanum commersonii]